jgi:LysM repeat protein
MPPGWQVYRVQSGDTLFLIGLQYGLTVTTIMDSNCLDTTTIAAGQMLYVPPVTPRPLPVNSAGARQPTFPMLTGTHTATDGACTDVDSTIRFPNVGAMLNGLVRIVGTARALNFAYYELEIRQEGSEQAYANLYTSHDPVTDGELGQWDTSLFPNGEYWLRLTVINNDNAYLEPCAILVAVINLT